MNTSLTATELKQLDQFMKRCTDMDANMLDGYLAALSSSPNLVMPDQWLRRICDVESVDLSAEFEMINLIMRQYQAVNDALNDQTFEPRMADPHAWCRGYLVGFAANMNDWAPMMLAQPELLKTILLYGNKVDAEEVATGSIAETARQIHAFWLEQRRSGLLTGNMLGIVTATGWPASAAQWLQ